MESMLNGRATHLEKGITSFSGSRRMGASLLETQIRTRSTFHLTLVISVKNPTVLRCLKWAGSRSLIKMVKQCGLQIRLLLSVRGVIHLRTECAQTAITKKQ